MIISKQYQKEMQLTKFAHSRIINYVESDSSLCAVERHNNIMKGTDYLGNRQHHEGSREGTTGNLKMMAKRALVTLQQAQNADDAYPSKW
jgi:hypothetical protein